MRKDNYLLTEIRRRERLMVKKRVLRNVAGVLIVSLITACIGLDFYFS
jgi:hypothetical protein